MPIRDEPSFDPGLVGFPTGYLNDCLDVNTSGYYDGALLVYSDAVTGWIIGSGAVATGSLNSLSDVDVSSAVTGQVLGLIGGTWQGVTVTGLQGPTGLQGATGLQGPAGTGGGASTLDDLTDVSTTGDLQTNMWLGYNGAYWRQSYFDTTNLSNVSGHALVDQDHSLVYFPTVNKYISTHVLAAPSGLRAVDSLTYAIGNTNILQAALNKGGMVFLPSGNYLVTGIILSVADTVLFGQGVIKCYTGAICDAVVTINATGCKIRDIGIDGNGTSRSSLSGSLIKIGRGEGLRVNGNNNLIDSVRIYNIPTGSSSVSAASYAVGDNNTFRNVFISGGDIAAFRNFGNNTYRDCIAVGWGYKGFSHVGEGDLLVVDGFYSVCNTPWFTNGRCNFQIDPSTRYLQQASLTNIRTESTTGLLGNGDAAFKAALVGTLNINNCYLNHNSGVIDTIIIAEDVKNINIDNSTIAKHINFNINVSSIPNNFTLKNSTLGITGQWIANSNIFDLQCSGTMLIENCTFYGFTQRAIDFDCASGTFDSLRITDCMFIGSGATVYNIDSTSGGLGAGNKIIHLRNATRNLSGGNSVTSSSDSKRRVLSTIDDGGMNYLYASAPSSASDGYWTAGTRIYNTTLISGGAMGWICTNNGTPGNWEIFGDLGRVSAPYAPTGLLIATGATNTSTIENHINSVGYTYIPSGTWYVGTQINVTKPGAKLFGPGTIRAREGFIQTSMINMAATGCTIEDIFLDGAGTTPTSVSIGINMGGDDCTIRNVTITGINNYHSVNAPGRRALIENCKIYSTSGTAASCIDSSGPSVTIKDCFLNNIGRKGIILDHAKAGNDTEAYAVIDNCFITNSGITAKEGVAFNSILMDPGTGTPRYDSIVIRDTRVEFRNIPTGLSVAGDLNSAMVKIALCNHATIDGCSFYSKATGANLAFGLGFAQRLGKVKITNSYISPSIEQTLPSLYNDTIDIDNCWIGNYTLPYHSGYSAINELSAKIIKINNCDIVTSGVASAILIEEGITNEKIVVTDCRVSGWRDVGGTFSALNYPSGSSLYPTRKIFWNNNKLELGQGTGPFSAFQVAVRILQTAKDLGGTVFTITGAVGNNVPTGNSSFNQIQFTRGDQVLNTGGTLTIGNSMGWVCVTGGPGSGAGTWLPFGTL